MPLYGNETHKLPKQLGVAICISNEAGNKMVGARARKASGEKGASVTSESLARALSQMTSHFL
jgi:hypothetical protein